MRRLAASNATPAGERPGEEKEMVAMRVPTVISAAKYARDDQRSRLASTRASTGTAKDTSRSAGEVM